MKPANAWQKGTSGNPGGRPKLPDATQRLKETARIETIEALAKIMTMTREELAGVATDPTAPAALILAASVMHKAIKLGCPTRAQLILSYVIGKPETSQIETEAENPNYKPIRLAYNRDDLGA